MITVIPKVWIYQCHKLTVIFKNYIKKVLILLNLCPAFFNLSLIHLFIVLN